MTAATVVCCNMISLSQTRYGSAVLPGSARQGRRRRWRSYQANNARAGKMPRERISDGNTHAGMTKLSRPVHGPRPIAAVVPVVTRNAFNRAAPGVAQLMEAWAGIVGPALAEVTTPRRLSQGTLTIGCSGPVAMELQHLSIEVLARINQYLGSQVARRLRFVQFTAVRAPVRL